MCLSMWKAGVDLGIGVRTSLILIMISNSFFSWFYGNNSMEMDRNKWKPREK